ncbi:hypothetical protein [Carnobacterium mobile]|uniref:hypothetical protein n=1 Tax=Carnobacterium mobile TaxID=2750 RepID=UPI0005579A9F|nr:hypothetical protein [Carnobacterium mobile]
MTKLNYERMYKDLTNKIVTLKGTDPLGQKVETKTVINLLNIVEDHEKELVKSEAPEQIESTNSEPTDQPANLIRDFARSNRIVKD